MKTLKTIMAVVLATAALSTCAFAKYVPNAAHCPTDNNFAPVDCQDTTITVLEDGKYDDSKVDVVYGWDYTQWWLSNARYNGEAFDETVVYEFVDPTAPGFVYDRNTYPFFVEDVDRNVIPGNGRIQVGHYADYDVITVDNVNPTSTSSFRTIGK